MPWRSAFRVRAQSLAVLILSSLIVVSCTTVASTDSEAGPRDSSTQAAAAAVPSPMADATATPASVPSPSPSSAASPAPAIAGSPRPAPASIPAAAPSAAPTPALASSSIVVPGASVEPVEREQADTPAPAGSTLDEKTVAKLQKIIDHQVQNKRVAGLQVAVRLPDGQTWLGTAGNAEFSPERALESNDQMAIASVTKTFVAALILRLAEEGKIDLDAPFGTYFRDAPRKDKVTIRQLLSHRSGIYNFWANPRYLNVISRAWFEDPDAGGLKARTHRWTYDEMMKLVKGGQFKPGQDYQYSNTNYVILGKVAEAVEGKPLHQQLRQRFFKPLGLDDTIYQPAQKPRPDAAHGHWDWGGGWTDHTGDSVYVPFMAAATVADAAGAMASTARDLSVWASALYGGEVLSPRMTRQMTTFLEPGWYGLGADVAVFAGHRGHGHRGGIRGYESSMWYFPAEGVSIVLLSNQGNWLTDKPMEKLVRTALGSGSSAASR